MSKGFFDCVDVRVFCGQCCVKLPDTHKIIGNARLHLHVLLENAVNNVAGSVLR